MDSEDESPSAVPAWFVTFADMMTLLLTFFIMLASMSELKTEKLYQSMAQSMRRKFGHDAGLVSLVADGARGDANLQGLATMGRTRRAKLMRDGESPDEAIQSARSAEDQKPTRSGVVYFAEGASDLTAADRRQLQTVAEQLRAGKQAVEVRGHISQRPISPDSPYRDGWDLAYARCRKTMELLVATGIEPRRIRIGVTPILEPKAPATKPSPGKTGVGDVRRDSQVELWIFADRAGEVARSVGRNNR